MSDEDKPKLEIVGEPGQVTPPSPPDPRQLLSVALGNIVVTDFGVEVTLVFPKEVLFTEDQLAEALSEQPSD